MLNGCSLPLFNESFSENDNGGANELFLKMAKYKSEVSASSMLKHLRPLKYQTTLSRQEIVDNDKKLTKYLAKFVYQVEKVRFEERPNYDKFIEVLERCQQLMSWDSLTVTIPLFDIETINYYNKSRHTQIIS